MHLAGNSPSLVDRLDPEHRAETRSEHQDNNSLMGLRPVPVFPHVFSGATLQKKLTVITPLATLR